MQAAKAIGNWFNSTVGAAARWSWDKVSHPGRTLNEMGTGIKAWYNAFANQTRSAASAWLGPKAPEQPVAVAAAPAVSQPAAFVPVTQAPTVDMAFQAAMSQLDAAGAPALS